MNREVTFAHLTDPHFTVPSFASWREIANKRALSVLSWRWKRRHKYKLAVFEALARDASSRTNRLVLTGDLTQAGLISECQAARDWLAAFATDNEICVIPGNHDSIRIDGEHADWETRWAPWMGDDGTGVPFVRTFGCAAFIGLSSAVPTAPFLASGRIGRAQLREFRHMLIKCREAGLCRVVLVHHCPVPGLDSPRRGLADANTFCEIVAEEGAELILHGHNHRWMHNAVAGPFGEVPVLSVPSAGSVGMPDGRYRAGYSLITIVDGGETWEMRVQARELAESVAKQGEMRYYTLTKADPGAP